MPAKKFDPRKLTPLGAEQILRALEIQKDTEYAGDNLKFFLEQAWPTMQPGVPFQDNWHVGCLTEHLEALAARQIRRLIINISPRSLKSTIISVAFPAWRWIKCPEEKFLAASYGLKLALRDSRHTRDLIKSQWYQVRWGKNFRLALDQNEKGRFDNDKGGFRMIASVEGGVLGEGGSVAILDDCNDLDKMDEEPDTYPQSVREWYSRTMSSRSIDPRTDVRLCVQQRCSHGGDLTEYLLELGGWEQLVIPNEWQGKTIIGPLAYQDPRTHLGELMFPDRLGSEDTATLKREKRQHYPGQYNQIPDKDGKSGLKKEWFQFYNPAGAKATDAEGKPIPVRIALTDGSYVERIPVELPVAFEQIVHSVDCAFKSAEENDFVANHVWARTGANTYLMARETDHLSFTQTLASIRRMSELFPCPEKLVEDKANGPAVIDTLKNEIPGLIPVNPAGGKWSRVAAISGYVEAGNVHLPNPNIYPWVWELLTEFASGQAAKHDDDTDAMSQALKRLYDANARAGVPEFRVAPRLGEPQTAMHISAESVPLECRRFVVIVPDRAALWMAETRTGSIRVLRELALEKMDALASGREIMRQTLPELLAKQQHDAKTISIAPQRRGMVTAYELFLPKRAFAPMEPVGCWAELMEQSMLGFEPEQAGWEERNQARLTIQAARIRTDMVEEERDNLTAIDRLRGLLAFQPPDFRLQEYNRQTALDLARQDLREYHRYIGMTEGVVVGEWPKLKIHPSCLQLIAELGAFRKDSVHPPPFVEALLLGCSIPHTITEEKQEIREMPWPQVAHQSRRSGRLLGKKFALR